MLRNVSLVRVAVTMVGMLVLAGCSGQPGYPLSGKVTFAGKPIPQGKIYFIPDSAKGNKGASGFADIKNGQYNTANGGKRQIGGAMIVKIEGFDPSVKATPAPGDTSGETTIKSLFPAVEMPMDLPKSSGTKDFDVPEVAATRQVGSESGAANVGP